MNLNEELFENIINLQNLEFESLSAKYIYVSGNANIVNATIHNTLSARYGVFNTLSANSISSTNFLGDGSGLTNLVIDTSGFLQVIGDGISTDYIINHNFNTPNTIIQIYDNVTETVIYPTIQNIDQNNTLIHFKNPPALSAYKVLILV